MSATPLDGGALRRRLANGETTVGTFVGMASATATEVCAAAGADWVLIDLEHGAGSEDVIRDGVLDSKPVSGLPAMRRLFDIVLHPQFAQNNWVYFDYSRAGTDARTPLALARAVYQNGTLTNVQELYVSDPTSQGGSRMAFAPDGKTLWVPQTGDIANFTKGGQAGS